MLSKLCSRLCPSKLGAKKEKFESRPTLSGKTLNDVTFNPDGPYLVLEIGDGDMEAEQILIDSQGYAHRIGNEDAFIIRFDND